MSKLSRTGFALVTMFLLSGAAVVPAMAAPPPETTTANADASEAMGLLDGWISRLDEYADSIDYSEPAAAMSQVSAYVEVPLKTAPRIVIVTILFVAMMMIVKKAVGT